MLPDGGANAGSSSANANWMATGLLLAQYGRRAAILGSLDFCGGSEHEKNFMLLRFAQMGFPLEFTS
jgi:hypothetical protein